MSDNNIISVNKEISNLFQNKNQDSNTNISSSPKHNSSSTNLQLFKNTEINQRNFPSKANYFGQNNSRANTNNSHKRNISPENQSPLFNYYTSLSPKFSKIGQFYSPEHNFGGESTGNIAGETFNFSPSNIFNNNMNHMNNTNNNYNIFNNNFNSHQSGDGLNFNHNTNNSKTLAEKMEHLVGKNDDNNLVEKNQNNNNNEQKSDDEEDNENDEMYLLALNISDEKENEEEINNNPHSIGVNDNNILNNLNQNIINPQLNINPQFDINQNQNIVSSLSKQIDNNKNINNKNNINNSSNTNNTINANDIMNNMTNQNNIINNNIGNLENISDNNTQNEKKVGMAEKIIHSGEFPKPYIPNKFRNNNMEVNEINNLQNDNILPAYGGTQNNNKNNLVNNFTINNNINNNFNINNSIINNNNLIGNPNFNINYNNLNNNINANPNLANNIIMMNKNNSFPMNKEKEAFPYPTKIGELLYQNKPPNPNPHPKPFNHNNENKFEINNNMNNFIQMPQGSHYNNNFMNNNFANNYNMNNNYIFHYKGDNYQINQFKQYKKNENTKDGQIRSICEDDLVTTITANNKKIKRIDPNTYLNESLEYLCFNILPLAKDQAGCRFLQEKLEKDPQATNLFFDAIFPHITTLVKDPFGNYLIQKICNNLNQDQIIKVLEKISPTILDIGSNNHGTRVVQHLINFLKTKKSIDCFLKSIEPYVIPLLKELNGTHIIQQFLMKHPDCAYVINKIIVDNCASLASHSHGCCVLQKFLNGKDVSLKESLINNLINNCLVLIIDQYGNYVIQSILLLNENKSSSAIAMKIYDHVAYYSKHRYSSNVVEKCFDFCGKPERKRLAEKLSPPDILADLIMDEHGNYVIQKALSCSEKKEQDIILKNIVPLVPKIKSVSFGEKLLSRLMNTYPQFKNDVQMMEGNINIRNLGNTNNNNLNFNFQNMNNNSGFNNKKGNKKKRNNNNINNNNNNNYFDNNLGYNNNFINGSNFMNNNMYFNKNENFEDDRNNNYGKNRGNKKFNKNRGFKNNDQKKRKNNFNNNDKSNNNNQ